MSIEHKGDGVKSVYMAPTFQTKALYAKCPAFLLGIRDMLL